MTTHDSDYDPRAFWWALAIAAGVAWALAAAWFALPAPVVVGVGLSVAFLVLLAGSLCLGAGRHSREEEER